MKENVILEKNIFSMGGIQERKCNFIKILYQLCVYTCLYTTRRLQK